MMEIVLASHNPGKLAECQSLFAGLGLTLRTAAELELSEPAEPFATFLENALHKARHVAQTSGLPALADDSGLVVDVLDGAPGVHSAYAARQFGASSGPWPNARSERDARNNAWLLQALHDQRAVTPQARHARFVCVLVALRQADDPMPLIALGQLPGQIAHAAQGAQGFGYDPLFIPMQPTQGQPSGATLGNYDAAQKHTISHRASAARQMRDLLRAFWHVREQSL